MLIAAPHSSPGVHQLLFFISHSNWHIHLRHDAFQRHLHRHRISHRRLSRMKVTANIFLRMSLRKVDLWILWATTMCESRSSSLGHQSRDPVVSVLDKIFFFFSNSIPANILRCWYSRKHVISICDFTWMLWYIHRAYRIALPKIKAKNSSLSFSRVS